MIRIDSKRNKFTYNIYHIVKAFYPGEEVEQKVDGEQEALVTVEMPGGSSFSVSAEDLGLPRISDPDERQLQEEKWAGDLDGSAPDQADHAEAGGGDQPGRDPEILSGGRPRQPGEGAACV